jgi:hypothetical protein
LAAYNAGVHRVKGHQVPRIRETRLYVRKVLRYYNQLRVPPKRFREKPGNSLPDRGDSRRKPRESRPWPSSTSTADVPAGLA